jgi:hypothetical protein
MAGARLVGDLVFRNDIFHLFLQESAMKKTVLGLLLLIPSMLCGQAKPLAQNAAPKVAPPIQAAQPATIEPVAAHGQVGEIPQLNPAVVTQHERIQRLAGPKTKQKAAQMAPGFSARVRQLPPTADFHGLAVAEARSASADLGALSDANIEAIAFLVMMQAGKDAQNDLKSIMDETQKANQKKQAMRQEQNKKQSDSMSEMGEMDSLRLQMAMDRASKFMQTLSNMEKKMSETSDAVVKNLK